MLPSIIHASDENRDLPDEEEGGRHRPRLALVKRAAPPAGASEVMLRQSCEVGVGLVLSSSAFIRVLGQRVNAPLLRFQSAAK